MDIERMVLFIRITIYFNFILLFINISSSAKYVEYRKRKGYKTQITQKNPYIWEIKTKPSGFIANLTKKTNIIEIWATSNSSCEDGVLFHIRYFNKGKIFFDSEKISGKEVIKKIREEESWWMFDHE